MTSVRSLGEALARLEATTGSVAEILGLVPRLVCSLGFDRALVSRVDDGLWTSESAFVVGDPEWAERINLAGREVPERLVPGLVESEIVRRREALIVSDVQHEPGVHRRIADVSQSRSYVAAPIVSGGQVVGLVHADRYLQGRDLTEDDKDLLVAFTYGLQLALSRATTSARLHSVEQSMAETLAALRWAASDVRDVVLGGVPAQPLAPESPAPAPAQAVGLTERERQVFERVVEGKTNSAIAGELFIAESTVKRHVKHILRKLRARNRSEAISVWFQAQHVSRREADERAAAQSSA